MLYKTNHFQLPFKESICPRRALRISSKNFLGIIVHSTITFIM
ncbi:hypothetical protein ES703_27718 [subsurface metagenome]